jgi:hypothetical protein
MLSGGKATHNTVNKDASGRNASDEYTIVGPISLAIPTVRNKLDGQLQSRMLILGLEDYEGRTAAHTKAISEQFSGDYASVDYGEELHAWQAALGSLDGVRRVIFPVVHEQFAFSSDQVPHGSRLWGNVLALLCTNAWLEQRNRKLVTLQSGEQAIMASPEDYKVAYEIFNAACERSIANFSEAHRKILSAVYQLHREFKQKFPWNDNSQRVACSLSLVDTSGHETILEGSQAEGAGSFGSRHGSQGGCRGLRRLAPLDQTLA